MLSAVLLLTSCLSNDNDDIDYPSDAAIIAFSLGNLNRQMTTKAKDGSDSTYTATITGSNYKFYIDQLNHQIYNPDSLPYGTNVKRVICTITSKHSGLVTIKSLTSDSVTVYNSKDSIDFSQPRTVKVNSLDGKNIVSYTVNVNVHKEKPDTFMWHSAGPEEVFSQATAMKAFHLNGRIFVFASYEFEGAIYSCEESNNPEWQLEMWDLGFAIPQDIHENVAANDDKIYVNVKGGIYYTTDGSHWDQCGEMCPGKLVGATKHSLYALTEDGIARSDDEGLNWEKEQLDTDPILLPTDDISFVRIPSRVNESVDNIVILGNRSNFFFPNDINAVVWNKVEDEEDKDIPWMYVSQMDQPKNSLPRLSALSATIYNGSILAAGGPGIGACDNAGFENFYQSLEGGIYWLNSTTPKLPVDLECGKAFTMTVDSHNYLWLICGGTGVIWRGRMSGDSTTPQTAFTE
jgi:hypothetical protein